MRTRLLVTLGVVVGLVGASVAGVALAWIAKNDGFAQELVLTGYQFKAFAMARAGLVAGAVTAAIGVALAIVGFLTRARVTR